MLNLHVEPAVLLEHEELLKHGIEEGHALTERNSTRLTTEELDCLNIGVDRHLLLIIVEEYLYVHLLFLEIE